MRKYKFYIQIAICVMLISVTAACGQMNHPAAVTWHNTVSRLVMTELTKEQVEDAWITMFTALSEAPSKAVSTIIAVNQATQYGEPIDEKSTTRMKQVHAVCGGMVLKSGKNEEYGLYIEIKHEDAVSVYGNLTGISVVEDERVQRGEIIGSYDSLSEEEFYYELRTNL